jgi:hypothetical protein
LARAVTLLGIGAVLAGTLLLQSANAQYSNATFSKKRKPDTGPRAVGLLRIDAKGGAQLVPVVIMINGKFYDAGAYKADPVPMALQQGVVYEAFQSGVSQGLFTTFGAAQQAQQGWFANGKWRTHAQIEAAKAKAKTEAEKKAQKASEDPINSGPPRLRHPGDAPQTSPSSQPPAKSAPSASSPSTPASTGSAQASGSASSAPPVLSRPPAKASPAEEDTGRPVLRRQDPSETAHEQTEVTPDAIKDPVLLIPAISDAGGPEARPYGYQMKPEEEAVFLKKMLAIAATEVNGWAAALGKDTEPEAKPKASGKPALSKTKGSVRPSPAPEFQDVQLHVFDLSNSNEPVLILTATANLPSRPDLVFMIALVARNDIYGELHKVSSQVTDNHHLDAIPKYEFIDAVDVDGDGRAELLFRLSSDAGTAYAVYSVIGDKLWPLFEGKPGT